MQVAHPPDGIDADDFKDVFDPGACLSVWLAGK